MKDKQRHVTNQTYNDSAKNYEDSFINVTLYNDSFNDFCNLILKKNAKILDIACGPGNITKYILSKRPDFNILGVDIAPKMIELATLNNPSAQFKVMDFRIVSTLNTKYDAILNSFCMPYLSKKECAQIIKDSSNLLESGGYMYLSTMEGKDTDSGYEVASFDQRKKVYIHYHQKNYLTKCFSDSNFNIIDFQLVKSPKSDGSFFTDMIFILMKQ